MSRVRSAPISPPKDEWTQTCSSTHIFMRKLFEDAGHLVRVALVFAVALVAFLVFRSVMVPRSFGQYGHYRGNAIKEAAARPIVYAGRDACADCHADILKTKASGKHAKLGCEACHGALAKHAADPSALKPVLPDTAKLCVRCHEANAAKPVGFPQVNAQEHSGGAACGGCHNPHSPAIEGGGTGK